MISIMKIFKFFIRDKKSIYAENLYWEIVKISRNPNIYKSFNVNDTIDGRFDVLLLHLFLVINHLQSISENVLADSLLSHFIKDMDRSLREIGVGDPSISRKMRKIGEAYMGRMQSYKNSFKMNDYKMLSRGLHKNIYREQKVDIKYITSLTNYVLEYKKELKKFVLYQSLQKPVFNF